MRDHLLAAVLTFAFVSIFLTVVIALGWTIANFPIVAVAVCVIAVSFWPVYALYIFCLGAIRDEYYD